MENQLKATELQKQVRIGNYLLGKVEDELDERKTYWEIYQIKDSNDFAGIRDEWDKPIQLTEDILVKLGFEKRTNINPPFRNYQYIFSKDGFLIGSDFMFHYVSGNVTIKYVHQLQNLFFALTGEELTFKK